MYFASGKTKGTLHFYQNKKSGKHTYFYERGNIKQEEDYNTLGKLISKQSYFSNSILKSTSTVLYRDDKLLYKKTNTYTTTKNYNVEGNLS